MNTFPYLGFVHLVLIVIVGCMNVSYPVMAQPVSLSTAQLPPPPPSTPPPNRTRSGGSLSQSTACRLSDQALSSQALSSQTLIALIPVENPVLTIAAQPTFLFYVPYRSTEVSYGEFSMLIGPNEMTRLYHTQFMLPDTPGIVTLQLPADYALAEGVDYHWYFKLYCQGNSTPRADVDVNGWIRRIAHTPEADRQINAATPDIWYDALALLADRLQQSPQDTLLKTNWQTLLTSIGLDNLAQAPIVGSVGLSPVPISPFSEQHD